MSILIFLAVITVIVAIHEYGHYVACRAFGIPVASFSVGMGPRLMSRVDKRGTEWKLAALPIGGYISMDPTAHERAAPWKKIIISAAGPAINIFTALLIVFAFGGLSGVIGAFTALGDIYIATAQAIFKTLTFQGTNDLVGPVGIVSGSSEATAIPLSMNVLVLFVSMNIAVAIFNLLPFPPLDGGHIVVSCIEGVFGKQAANTVFNILAPVGILGLIVLTIMVLIKDIGTL